MKRSAIILALIVFQIVSALTVGFIAVNIQDGKLVADGVMSSTLSLSGMTVNEAVEAVNEQFQETLTKGQVRIRYGFDEFVFQFAEIEAEIDRVWLAQEIEEKSSQARELNLLSSNWRNYTVFIYPRITFNDEAFKGLLYQIKPIIERKPVNANIDIVGGKLSITPDSNGVFFDVDKFYESIKDRFLSNPFSVLMLSNRVNREIQVQQARITTDLLINMETVIAEASTPIAPGYNRELMIEAADSINKVFLHALEGEGNTRRADIFSLDKYLTRQGIQNNTVVDELNQLASTLYIALLRAGIKREGVSLYHQDRKADYCDLGFEVSVLGSGRDFKFENSLKSDIIIFAAVEDDTLSVKIAGRFDEENTHTRIISSRTTETFEPEVIYIETFDLTPGTEVVLDEGVAGHTVAIFRDVEQIEEIEYRSQPRTVMRGALL